MIPVLLTLVLGACYFDAPRSAVCRTEFIHDVPRDCPNLPPFPSVALLSNGNARLSDGVTPYVRGVEQWVLAANACLHSDAYPIHGILDERVSDVQVTP